MVPNHYDPPHPIPIQRPRPADGPTSSGAIKAAELITNQTIDSAAVFETAMGRKTVRGIANLIDEHTQENVAWVTVNWLQATLITKDLLDKDMSFRLEPADDHKYKIVYASDDSRYNAVIDRHLVMHGLRPDTHTCVVINRPEWFVREDFKRFINSNTNARNGHRVATWHGGGEPHEFSDIFTWYDHGEGSDFGSDGDDSIPDDIWNQIGLAVEAAGCCDALVWIKNLR